MNKSETKIYNIAPPSDALKSGGAEGDCMEQRLIKIEADVDNLKTSVSEIKCDIRELRQDNKSLLNKINSNHESLLGKISDNAKFHAGLSITILCAVIGLILAILFK